LVVGVRCPGGLRLILAMLDDVSSAPMRTPVGTFSGSACRVSMARIVRVQRRTVYSLADAVKAETVIVARRRSRLATRCSGFEHGHGYVISGFGGSVTVAGSEEANLSR
jgi:hypothetical protein